MQNAASADAQSDNRNETCGSIVANLATLIEHLNASSRALELAIASEAAHDGLDGPEDIVVLDDVTPCYLSANAALNACNAWLVVALRTLLDAHPTKVES
ncbi:MAG TPA: hypothetical protein VHB49_08670 [Bradyrhizobium sp.]|nr:hypothetical protein [Bradyrhizobium sp.]